MCGVCVCVCVVEAPELTTVLALVFIFVVVTFTTFSISNNFSNLRLGALVCDEDAQSGAVHAMRISASMNSNRESVRYANEDVLRTKDAERNTVCTSVSVTFIGEILNFLINCTNAVNCTPLVLLRLLLLFLFLLLSAF